MRTNGDRGFILVVDDDQEVREMLCDIFGANGYRAGWRPTAARGSWRSRPSARRSRSRT